MYENDLAPEVALGRESATIAMQRFRSDQQDPGLPVHTGGVRSQKGFSLPVNGFGWSYLGRHLYDEMIAFLDERYTTVGVPTAWDLPLYTIEPMAQRMLDANQIDQSFLRTESGQSSGHSNTTYTMRLSNNQVKISTITNDGATHNFSIYFTQGCYSVPLTTATQKLAICWRLRHRKDDLHY
jgi:hypothetical protein